MIFYPTEEFGIPVRDLRLPALSIHSISLGCRTLTSSTLVSPPYGTQSKEQPKVYILTLPTPATRMDRREGMLSALEEPFHKIYSLEQEPVPI